MGWAYMDTRYQFDFISFVQLSTLLAEYNYHPYHILNSVLAKCVLSSCDPKPFLPSMLPAAAVYLARARPRCLASSRVSRICRASLPSDPRPRVPDWSRRPTTVDLGPQPP